MIKYYNINGEIVPIEKATINVNDLGFLRGYSVFDFFRIFKGKPVFIQDHLARLEKSATNLGLEIPFSRKALIEKIIALAKCNKMEFGGIKIILTGGYSTNGWLPAKPNLIILAGELPKYPESYYTKGVKLMTYEYVRDTPYTKSTNYMVSISLDEEIKAAEAFDVLYHSKGFISESARSNFFMVDQKGTIITPQKDALEGITRKQVLELANKHFEVEIRPLSLMDTRQAKEVFITSSTKKVMPVRQIDFWRINKGIIGETTKKIMRLFQTEVEASIAELIGSQ